MSDIEAMISLISIAKKRAQELPMATPKSKTTSSAEKTPPSSKTSPVQKWVEDYDGLMGKGELKKAQAAARKLGLKLEPQNPT